MTTSRLGRHAAHRESHRSWRLPWLETLAAILILAGVMTFMYPRTASWFSQREQSRVTEMALNEMREAPTNDAAYRAEQIARAHEYNGALASGAVYRANENIASSDINVADEKLDYDSILDTTGNGFMGRLRYESLDIDLPIYHGTSDETLQRGIGHLEGTSLPVGGNETRSVLTAHRGLPESTLFTHLDRAQIGDRLTVSVLDQTLTYEVVETVVIDPDETEAILPVENTDMVTLVTCTPLGVNSHRILVNAVRVKPTPLADELAAAEKSELPGFPWWAVVLSAVLLAAIAFVWRSGYAQAKRHTRASERRAAENT
ncbi:class C sortase (plasmid) [Glutamicibacter sp. FR1]|uniref:class C sortase n=1 Tax=Glutamicibacter sp. FR1 TaxID=3393744 RepID=UPI0039AF90CA